MSGGAMNGATVSPINRHVERELDVPDGAEVACQLRDFDPRLTRQQCEGDRVCDLGRQRLGLRTTYGHDHRRVKVGAVEISQRRDGLTHLGQPLARRDHGQPPFAELVLDSGLPVPMPISKRPSVSTDSECASHAVLQAGRSGEAYTQVPTRRSVRRRDGASVGPGAGCHCGTSGISSVE